MYLLFNNVLSKLLIIQSQIFGGQKMKILNNDNNFIECVQNLDGKVDYETLFKEFSPSLKSQGDQLIGSCPFPNHHDEHPSFNVNKFTGQYYCHGCGKKGNGVTFLMDIHGLSPYEALKKLYDYTNLELPSSVPNRLSSMESYCLEKNLPLNLLKDMGITESKGTLIIPYKDKNNVLIRNRHRSNGNFKHLWGPSLDRPIDLYGLWLMTDFENDFLILVEGESDTHTLLLNNFPCLGVPGASSFKPEWVEHINHFKKIYLFVEPDKGGELFSKKIIGNLASKSYQGEVFTFSFKHFKDPNEAWCSINNRLEFIDFMNEHLANAVPIDLKTQKEKQITFSPIPLRGLKNYDVTKNGVYRIVKDDDTEKYIPVITTPIVISGRVKLFNSPLEQVEISYFKDNRWHKMTCTRSELFNTRAVIKLADVGINVSSNNAKALVYYLEELQNCNKDNFPVLYTVKHLGWHGNSFIPYGDCNFLLADEDELKSIGEGFTTKGSFEDNLDYMYSIINTHPLVRLYVMASCASPFLKDLEQRIMCIYIWAQSRSGKTAALQLALSIWGDPRKLMKNFNATACGLEETCNILKHLPLGLNERQQRLNDKASQQLLENLIYMLAEGTGRSRSSKNGGIKATTQWHNIILANGEVPLLPENSHDGARNRCLEINDTPFEDEDTAKRVYSKVSELHGTLGEAIVKYFLMSPDYLLLVDDVKKIIKTCEANLLHEFPHKNPTHLSLLATIFAIDCTLSTSIFARPHMTLNADAILTIYKGIAPILPNVSDYDLVNNFYETVKDWLSSNYNHFSTTTSCPTHTTIYGLVENTSTHVNYYIYQDVFRTFCESKNISYKQIMEVFANKGFIATEKPNGKGRRTVRKTFNGMQQQFILFSLPL